MLTWPYSAGVVLAVCGLIWAASVALESWLSRRRRHGGRYHVSDRWRDRQAWREMRAGDAWEGPRWMTPKERRSMARQQRREATGLRMVAGRGRHL